MKQYSKSVYIITAIILIVCLIFGSCVGRLLVDYNNRKVITKVVKCYHVDAEVVEIGNEEILFEDTSGTLWAIDYKEGYTLGEWVNLYMDNNGTEYTNTDDIIISVNR